MPRNKDTASEEIREEMHEAKKGRRQSEKQAVAIGLSKARRAGKDIPAPKRGATSEATRKRAQKDIAAGKKAKRTAATKKTSTKKSAAKKKSTTKRRA